MGNRRTKPPLFSNITGRWNTANGGLALFNNTSGDENVANGERALYSNTTGSDNAANGAYALSANTTGDDNTANGVYALERNTTGGGNTANGYATLGANVTGSYNTAIGNGAGADVTGDGNVCIGEGVRGFNGENNTTRIRNIYATAQPIVGTDPDSVTINSTGRLGRGNVSSRRYKHEIKAMDKASEAIFALKPVTFRYKQEFDPTQTLAFGLIAEDVEKVNPDLVGRNPEGEPESVHYEQINAMMLNEFLKEHRKVEEQEATIRQLSSIVAEQQKVFAARLKDQDSKIQAVNERLERATLLQVVDSK